MKEFFKVTTLSKVLEYVSDFSCVETEEVPLLDAAGRVLADDIISGHNLPDFSRSTMDGYAVRSADVKRGTSLKVVDEVTAGQVPSVAVTSGQATQIMTGAPLPSGADAVVPVEQAELTDTTVRLDVDRVSVLVHE